MNSLEKLAQLAGIEDRFQDAKGQVRETTPETKRALLAAMGYPTEDESSALAILRSLEEGAWHKSLPPVRVAYPDPGGIAIEFVVPEGSPEIPWVVRLETGETLSGAARCSNATCIDTCELDGRRLERHRVRLGREFPQGYHSLSCSFDDANCSLIVTPGKAWLPEGADEQRFWGVAAQLYLLRSERNWGIGDFTDLRKLVELVAQLGCDVVGLNPLHSMFVDNPEHASPYSPESRLLLNVFYIDIEAVPEFADSAETQQLVASESFQRRLAECRAAPLVDYAGVGELKMPALKLLFDCCRTSSDATRWRDFETFRERAGAPFEQNCLFEALRQHFANITGKLADWHSWPADYQDPDSEAVRVFAEENAGTVTLHAWLQWLADQQLAEAARAASGMAVGLYRDLAVGTDNSGAATWSRHDAVISGAHVGAPPDIFNPAGQDWGLPPFHPRVLFETGYGDFIDLVRANMRHAGGLRIDHVMALQHLYWVPAGKSPREGAYVRYPLEDLIGIIALESHRHRCLVVGEDLGTVPPGFRERMMEANILSYRVLFFEQDTRTGEFHPPDSYPRLALAVAGSHDLPTVYGWWDESDIDLKERLQLFPEDSPAAEARERRRRDRRELIRALRAAHLLPEDGPVEVEAFCTALHAYLARTNALITIAQLDDITAEIDPVNVPATSDQHPNWKRRLSVGLERLPHYPRLLTLAQIFERERRKDSR